MKLREAKLLESGRCGPWGQMQQKDLDNKNRDEVIRRTLLETAEN